MKLRPRATCALLLGIACTRGPEAPFHAEPPAPAAPVRDATPALRVCADPNNLPFTNERREGFENALAEIVARDLGRHVEYTWWAQRRGFLRATLRAGRCDVVMGVPVELEGTLPTRPYYRSSYAFVSRHARGLGLRSLDDPRLRQLTIGLHIVGDDYANVPPGDSLVTRGIVRNVRGYSLLGDYSRPNPPADLIEGVARGEVDVAIAWGPLAGYFASRQDPPLDVTPVAPSAGDGLQFSIAMGVRRGDLALRDALDGVLARRAAEFDTVLERFHVPRVRMRGYSVSKRSVTAPAAGPS